MKGVQGHPYHGPCCRSGGMGFALKDRPELFDPSGRTSSGVRWVLGPGARRGMLRGASAARRGGWGAGGGGEAGQGEARRNAMAARPQCGGACSRTGRRWMWQTQQAAPCGDVGASRGGRQQVQFRFSPGGISCPSSPAPAAANRPAAGVFGPLCSPLWSVGGEVRISCNPAMPSTPTGGRAC